MTTVETALEHPTIGVSVAAAAARLRTAGIPDARREARLLLAHALGVGPETVLGHPERAVDPGTAVHFDALVHRRIRREPTAYLLGLREFWSLPFRVTPDTLIPRPDSETLVEAALEGIGNRVAPLAVLDLGTGCGCLLIALLKELPRARGLGIDISEAVVSVASANAVALGVADRARFRRGDWGRGLEGAFDLIVVNPPYLATAGIDHLEPEVARYEPRRALDGGADGLEGYRALAPNLARLLAPRGRAVLEIGLGQRPAVAALLARHGLGVIGTGRDLGGIERCLVAASARP